MIESNGRTLIYEKQGLCYPIMETNPQDSGKPLYHYRIDLVVSCQVAHDLAIRRSLTFAGRRHRKDEAVAKNKEGCLPF